MEEFDQYCEPKQPGLFLGRRDETKPNKWENVLFIPQDEVCLVFFPGALAHSTREANGCLKGMQVFLTGKMEDINLYSVYYPQFANAEGKEKCKNYIQSSFFGTQAEEEYMDLLFDAIILPRLIDKEGHIAPTDDIKKNLSKMVFIGHSVGTVVLEKMLKKTRQTLQAYHVTDIDEIMACINAQAQAPVCAMQYSGANVFSFGSLSDKNEFSLFSNDHHAIGKMALYLKANKSDLSDFACFMPESKLFLVGQKFSHNETDINAEHDNVSYLHDDTLTTHGKKTVAFAGQMLLNALQFGQRYADRVGGQNLDLDTLLSGPNTLLKEEFKIWEKAGTDLQAKTPVVQAKQPVVKQKGNCSEKAA